MLTGEFKVAVIFGAAKERHHLHEMGFIFFMVMTSHGFIIFNLLTYDPVVIL